MKEQGIAAKSEEKVSAIAAAISGDGGKLFPLPLDHELGANADGSFDANAGAGRGSIFHGGGFAIGNACGVFPENLGDCPQDRSWFDVAAVHAMFIGRATGWISYQRGKFPKWNGFPN